VKKGPFFLEQSPQKKSDIPHPNIPPIPANILKIAELMGTLATLKNLLRQLAICKTEYLFEHTDHKKYCI
jgi:hypothetical protein